MALKKASQNKIINCSYKICSSTGSNKKRNTSNIKLISFYQSTMCHHPPKPPKPTYSSKLLTTIHIKVVCFSSMYFCFCSYFYFVYFFTQELENLCFWFILHSLYPTHMFSHHHFICAFCCCFSRVSFFFVVFYFHLFYFIIQAILALYTLLCK